MLNDWIGSDAVEVVYFQYLLFVFLFIIFEFSEVHLEFYSRNTSLHFLLTVCVIRAENFIYMTKADNYVLINL